MRVLGGTCSISNAIANACAERGLLWAGPLFLQELLKALERRQSVCKARYCRLQLRPK